MARVAEGYSNLELDLASGRRGSRHSHLGPLLASLTGAEDGLAVNNNAAALLLCLAATAAGREVLIGRGELIEIGDGFRIPDILAESSATLVEVGDDHAHPRGRLRAGRRRRDRCDPARPPVELPCRRLPPGAPPWPSWSPSERRHGVPVIDDLESGALVDLPDLADEPTARFSVEAGASLVCFSGDKLLGGPQAGIVVGRADAVERVRRHPLARALRLDKLSLAALEATLELYRDPPAAVRAVPVLRMVAEPAEEVRARAESLAGRLGGTVVETVGRVGGGALPLLELPSFACALDGGDSLAARLRELDPPVVARVREGRVLLDCRTLTAAECDLINLVARDRRAHRSRQDVARQALTGVDTDRLPEEKERGITIDLGFAPLELASQRLGRRRARATSGSSGTCSPGRPASTWRCSSSRRTTR